MSDSTEKKIGAEVTEQAAEVAAAEPEKKAKKLAANRTVFEPESKNANGLDEVIYQHYLAREIAAKEAKKSGAPAAPAQIGPMFGGIDVGMMRLPDEHPTYELVDLAKDVDEKDCELKGVPYRVYTPQKAAPEGGRACIVYVHGGGFVMGGLTRLNNINRRLADDGGMGVLFLAGLFLFGALFSFSFKRKRGQSVAYRIMEKPSQKRPADPSFSG